MTHLNELIALELGWRDLRPAMANMGRGQSTGIPPGELRTYVPNWAGDLNLMFGLIAQLSNDEYVQYLGYMDVIETNTLTVDGEIDYAVLRALIEATSEQRATAWLKVKGVEV